MRYLLIVLSILLYPLTSAYAEVGIGIELPSINIGINMPAYPSLVQVPGYPVYYDPEADSNYFFYDGLYWVYEGNSWYESGWYNGPWQAVGPEYVPLFVLRVPVRYYRRPPIYFHSWRADAPPHWGERWGRNWEQQHRGWNQMDRRSIPAPAPLPGYQRQYRGNRYPRTAEQQHAIQSQNYRYQPREGVTRQYFQHHGQPDQQQRQNPQAGPHDQHSQHDNRDHNQQ